MTPDSQTGLPSPKEARSDQDPATAKRQSPTAIVARPYDARAYRSRRWACRQLDALLGDEVAPLVLVDRGDYFRDCEMDRDVAQRDYRGRELLAAGWTP